MLKFPNGKWVEVPETLQTAGDAAAQHCSLQKCVKRFLRSVLNVKLSSKSFRRTSVDHAAVTSAASNCAEDVRGHWLACPIAVVAFSDEHNGPWRLLLMIGGCRNNVHHSTGNLLRCVDGGGEGQWFPNIGQLSSCNSPNDDYVAILMPRLEELGMVGRKSSGAVVAKHEKIQEGVGEEYYTKLLQEC